MSKKWTLAALSLAAGIAAINTHLARKLRAAGDMLSGALSDDDPSSAVLALRGGAKGYITINEDPGRFVAAIKAVATGDSYVNSEMARRIALLRPDRSADGPPLTRREQEILRLFLSGHTIAEVTSLLEVSYETIANNFTQLKRKFGAKSGMDLMRIAMGRRKPKQLRVSKTRARPSRSSDSGKSSQPEN